MTRCGGPTIRFALLARGPYSLWGSGTEWTPSATIPTAGRWTSLQANWRLSRHHPLIALTPAWKGRARTVARARPLSKEAGRPRAPRCQHATFPRRLSTQFPIGRLRARKMSCRLHSGVRITDCFPSILSLPVVRFEDGPSLRPR